MPSQRNHKSEIIIHKSTMFNYRPYAGRTGFALPPVQQFRNRHEDPLPMDKGLPPAHAGTRIHELSAPPSHLPQTRSRSHRTAFGRAISSPTRPVPHSATSIETLPVKPPSASLQTSKSPHPPHTDQHHRFQRFQFSVLGRHTLNM